MIRRLVIVLGILFFLFGIGYSLRNRNKPEETIKEPDKKSAFSELVNLPSPTPTITPTPTARPLSFKELNDRYGPCVYLPVLMYHHVEAIEPGQKIGSLTVTAEYFRKQMQYLKDKGYQPVSPNQVASFLDDAGGLPGKPVLITFDDGYSDNYTAAFPILREFSYSAVIFLPTGLMENSGYLTWSQIREMNDAGIAFGNHTWSHYSAGGAREKVMGEIVTADEQLTQKGLNNPKVFAYPYGSVNGNVEKDLEGWGYKMAFTTHSGATLCQKKRFELPRIRIGNAVLAAYGL